MSFLNQNFAGVQEAGVSNRLNLGWFNVIITDIEDKKTQKGNEYPEFKFEGYKGEYKGKVITTRMLLCNVAHPTSEQARNIANGQLKSILIAINAIDANGNCNLKSYADAKGKPFWLRTDVDENGYIVVAEFKPKDFVPPYEGSNEVQPPPPARRDAGSTAQSVPASANTGATADYADDIPF
jgi:hypothetical protein